MRKVPFLITNCPKCEKRIYLWSESDFHATIKNEKKEGFDFWFTCPECGAIGKHPECFLPTYLKEKLIHDAMQKKILIDFIFMAFGIVLLGLFMFFFLFR